MTTDEKRPPVTKQVGFWIAALLSLLAIVLVAVIGRGDGVVGGVGLGVVVLVAGYFGKKGNRAVAIGILAGLAAVWAIAPVLAIGFYFVICLGYHAC